MSATAGAIRAGRAFVEIFADDSKLKTGLGSAQQQLKAFGSSMATTGLKVFGGGLAIAAPMLAAVKTFTQTGDALDEMSSRTGLAVEFLSGLSHAANRSGTDLASLEVGIKKLQKTAYSAAESGGASAKAFDDLGVSFVGTDGKVKGTEQLFLETATALGKVKNETQKAALAVALFGRSGTAILPMLNDGKNGMAAMMEAAKRLGIIMSSEDAAAAGKLDDAWQRLTATLKKATMQIGAALAPTLTALGNSAAKSMGPVIEWIKVNKEWVVTLASVAAAAVIAGPALTGLGTAFMVAGKAMAIFTASSRASFLAMGLANPLVAALALAVGGLSLAFVHAKVTGQTFGEAILDLTHKFTGLRNALSDLHDEEKRGAAAGAPMNAANAAVAENTAPRGSKEEVAKREVLRQTAEKQVTEGETRLAALQSLKTRFAADKQSRGGPPSVQRGEVDKLVPEAYGNLAIGKPMASSIDDAIATQKNAIKGLKSELEDAVEQLSKSDAIRLQVEADRLNAEAFIGTPAYWMQTAKAAGDAAVGGLLGAFKKMGEQYRGVLDDLRKTQIEGIADPMERELAQIQQEFAERQRKAKPGERPIIEATRQQEEKNIRNKFADEEKKKAEEDRKKANEDRKQDADVARRAADEEARAQINATMRGRKRELALLDLEERDALTEDSEAGGKNSESIKRRFERQRKGLAESETTTQGAVGVMEKLSLGAGDTAASRTAKATEETAQNTRLLRERPKPSGTALLPKHADQRPDLPKPLSQPPDVLSGIAAQTFALLAQVTRTPAAVQSVVAGAARPVDNAAPEPSTTSTKQETKLAERIAKATEDAVPLAKKQLSLTQKLLMPAWAP